MTGPTHRRSEILDIARAFGRETVEDPVRRFSLGQDGGKDALLCGVRFAALGNCWGQRMNVCPGLLDT